MVYDYIIVGSGVSGNVCAFLLASRGKRCLILEKNYERKEKICGGGIPFKALKLLSENGMDIQSFLSHDVSVIDGDLAFFAERYEECLYKDGQKAVGSQRKVFDEFLMEQALTKGAEIIFNENVSDIKFVNGVYIVNGFKAKNIVLAIGARGFSQRYTKGQSIGISAQIIGQGDLKPNKFYYWYYEGTEDRYFWIFPIGKKRWNVGIWFRYPDNNMKKDFEKCWKHIFRKHFGENFIYTQKPVGEMLGNVDLRRVNYKNIYGIGDFAGVNNLKNGGGIYRSIKSVIEFCSKIDD